MIYLDNSATTKPHEDVLKTFLVVNEQYFANPASIHRAGVESNTLLTKAREQLASILHTEEKNILFTSGELSQIMLHFLVLQNQVILEESILLRQK